tara:strand:- start:734 stop:1120 length:387 start_codon:yes stop_codon:yes gene_type:complete
MSVTDEKCIEYFANPKIKMERKEQRQCDFKKEAIMAGKKKEIERKELAEQHKQEQEEFEETHSVDQAGLSKQKMHTSDERPDDENKGGKRRRRRKSRSKSRKSRRKSRKTKRKRRKSRKTKKRRRRRR